MKLEEFIDQLNEMIEENGSELEHFSVQLPPKTKCWEKDWTQFEVQCLSTDGTTVYLQCS